MLTLHESSSHTGWRPKPPSLHWLFEHDILHIELNLDFHIRDRLFRGGLSKFKGDNLLEEFRPVRRDPIDGRTLIA